MVRQGSFAARAGGRACHGYESARCGSANVFDYFEPRRGWRELAVTERRTKQDFRAQTKWRAARRAAAHRGG